MVKLKSQKEELMAKLGQVKLVLDSMQSIIVVAEKKLEKVFATKDHVNPNQKKLQRMTCEFYRSTKNKTKVDYEDLVTKAEDQKSCITKSVQKQLFMEMAFDALNNQVLLLKKGENMISIHPQPMCSTEDSPDLNLESLRDIIVSSCHCLYHPWCASAWFRSHSHCNDPLCGGLVHSI